jgi:hypothetical protein
MEANKFLTHPLKQDVPHSSDLALLLNGVAILFILLWQCPARLSLSHYKQQNLVDPPCSTVSIVVKFRLVHIFHRCSHSLLYAAKAESSRAFLCFRLTLDESVKSPIDQRCVQVGILPLIIGILI